MASHVWHHCFPYLLALWVIFEFLKNFSKFGAFAYAVLAVWNVLSYLLPVTSLTCPHPSGLRQNKFPLLGEVFSNPTDHTRARLMRLRPTVFSL